MFVNLTNYAIQKNCKNKIDECMLNYDDFRDWITDEFGLCKFQNILKQI